MKSAKTFLRDNIRTERPSEGWWKWLHNKIQTRHDPSLTTTQLFLQNEDLKPVEPERRAWGWTNFVAFWISDAFNINTWQIASSGIQMGMSWWQVWLTVWIGYFLAGCFVALVGRVGAVYHISFPVACRTSFGIFGSYWPVLNRIVMAFVWFGVQGWLGGECVQLMLQSIWPQAPKMKDSIPDKDTNTFEFLSFFLWWIAVLPLLWFPVHQLRHLFTVKSYLVPFAGFGFLIWAVVKAGGIGPVAKQPNTVYGSELGWAFVRSTLNCMANFAVLIMNNPDFSRFAKKPSSAMWPQILTIPLAFAITSFIGIIVSSASSVMYDETIWSPLDVLKKFLDGNKSGSRAGVFFIATVFAISQAGCNIAANSVSAGTDLAALLPKYVNIRRGSYICAIIGFIICPWKLLTDSNQFTTYLSSYTIFLSSIAGVLAADYYLVRKGKVLVDDLFTTRPDSAYMYKWGISWRAYTAYICGILLNIVGFAGSVGAKVPIGATHVYDLNYFGGFLVAVIVYWFLCWWKPVTGCNDKFSEKYAELYFAEYFDNEKVDDEEEDEDVSVERIEVTTDGKMGKLMTRIRSKF